MLVNKWIMFALAALGVVAPDILALPWTDVVSATTAAEINTLVGVVMAVIHVFAPPAGQTVKPTGNPVVTHD